VELGEVHGQIRALGNLCGAAKHKGDNRKAKEYWDRQQALRGDIQPARLKHERANSTPAALSATTVTGVPVRRERCASAPVAEDGDGHAAVAVAGPQTIFTSDESCDKGALSPPTSFTNIVPVIGVVSVAAGAGAGAPPDAIDPAAQISGDGRSGESPNPPEHAVAPTGSTGSFEVF
jgi:hypothetical protein